MLEAEAVLDRVAVVDEGRVIACDTPAGLKAEVGDEVRLDLVWRAEPPLDEPVVAVLAGRSRTDRPALERAAGPPTRPATRSPRLTGGPAFAALDDFTLATPTLEDVYLALGGRHDDLERG